MAATETVSQHIEERVLCTRRRLFWKGFQNISFRRKTVTAKETGAQIIKYFNYFKHEQISALTHCMTELEN